MTHERAWVRDLLAGTMVLGLLLTAGPGLRADEEKKKEERKAEEKKEAGEKPEAAPPAKPRVFTNADLERYARGGRGSVSGGSYTTEGRVIPTAPAPPAEAPPEAAPAPEAQVPPEDRPESATIPELEARLSALQAEQAYLSAKRRWLRNPLLPAPIPPPGEELLDEGLTGAEQLRRTETRLHLTENRLNKVRGLLQASGVTP